MTDDLDVSRQAPILVERATSLPTTDAGWELVQDVEAIRTRRAAGNDLGSTELAMRWGQIFDPNRTDTGLDRPSPPLAVDDCIRLRDSTIDDNNVIVPGDERWVGVIESIDWSDPKRAMVKAVDLGVLLARMYTSRGWELNHNDTLLVDPGYLPPFNAIPGGDCSTSDWESGYRVHDRRGTGQPWTAHRIAELLLRRGMRTDLPGAPEANAIRWRLDPASVGNYTPDTIDLNGKNLAECMDALFGARRGLTWRTTHAAGYAQVLVYSLDDAGTELDTTTDLAWTDPHIQERRDGYDYVLVTGSRPLIGITLWWTRGGSGGALEPDGWDPDTADAALAAALLEDWTGKAYDRPEWRRFKLKASWDGAQYDGSATGSGTIGLRSGLVDPNTYAPPDGTRWFQPGCPPPAILTIERDTPAGIGWTATPTGPRQAPVVIAGRGGVWRDLSKECRPTPIGGNASSERSDQGAVTILLGDTAEAADALRKEINTNGTLLVTIGIREWAPLQCAWAAPLDSWSTLSPRVYHLRRPAIEEWLCLDTTVKGLTSGGALDTISGGDLSVRTDVSKLQTLRDQLAVRFGRSITAATITYQDGILTTWDPGDVCSTLTLVDGRAFPLDMPCAECTWNWTFPRSTVLRFAPLLKETPSA